MRSVYQMQQGCSCHLWHYTLSLPCLWSLKPFGVEGVVLFCTKHIFQSTNILSVAKLLKLSARRFVHIRGGKNGGTWSE